MTALLGLSARLRMSTLCLVVDTRPRAGALVDVVRAAVAGGVDMVQLRDPNAGPEVLVESLRILSEALFGSQVLLAVHAFGDHPAANGADVLHLPLGADPAEARGALGEHGLLGRSAHDEDEFDVLMAPASRPVDRCDYLFVGPVWPGPVEGEEGSARRGGLALVRHAATACPPGAPGAVPWFAAGGITRDRVPAVLDAGARRVAVGRAITHAPDPERAAREIADLVTGRWRADPRTRASSFDALRG